MGGACLAALAVAALATVFGAPVLWELAGRGTGRSAVVLVFGPSLGYLAGVGYVLWRCASGGGWGWPGWAVGCGYLGMVVAGLHTRPEGYGSPLMLDLICAYLASLPYQIACALRRGAPGPRRVPPPRSSPQQSRSATRLAAGAAPTGWKSAAKRWYAAACAPATVARSPRASSTSSDVVSSGPGARSAKSK